MREESNDLVHIVDDDAGMRKSLSMLVESASLFVRAYDSAEEFLGHADLSQPGCIVLDLRMPGMGGIELLQHLRTKMIDMPVILISGHADVPTTVRGMKLGAVDLLQKPVEPTVLIDAIKRSIDASRAMHLRDINDQSIRRRFESLTLREMEILKQIVAGQPNKQIAVAMQISIKTVANHRANLMAKTGAHNAADLARLFTIASATQPSPKTSLPEN